MSELPDMSGLPLEGVRVVDITVVWAGPHVTQMLAEWGAEVIRVEPIQSIQPQSRGYETRLTKEQIAALRAQGLRGAGYPDFDPGERPWNRSPGFNAHARNKLSMTCDITLPEGLDIFKRLIAVSDVFVENNVPESIEKWGVTYEELVKVNPQLIMLRCPGFGLSGPYKNYRSLGIHMEAMAGHTWIRSYQDADPAYTGSAFTADAATGILGAAAVVMALRHRRRTGKGQQIEMSQTENFLPYIGEFILDYSMNGRVAGPQGNTHRSRAPHGVYPCMGTDRWLAIEVTTEGEWRALCRVMGDPEWTQQERFSTMAGRKANEEELNRLISEWTRKRDRYVLFRALQAAGVRAGPVQDEADAYACPHLQERGFFEELEHPDAGRHLYPGLNLRMSGTPNHLRRHACLLGEDNEYVYKEVIGVSDEEYQRLTELGHIGMQYAPGAVVGHADTD